MIYYDVTKMQGARGHSGLTRTSSRLLQELGDRVRCVTWERRGFALADEPAEDVAFRPEDWLLTVELFSEAERPGLREFLARRPCRLAAVFYDAIPLRFPHITWPQSVQRHPEYLKLLADFDRVFGISHYVAGDLAAFWRWQGLTPRAGVEAIMLGADLDRTERVAAPLARPPGTRAKLLAVGIVEPRKNQAFLLQVCQSLWRAGMDFDLEVVGRINPHFGAPIAKALRAAARKEPRLRFRESVSDAELRQLYATTSAVVFPTLAEGSGLPILEAAWHGVPCVCSDLPVLRENTAGGGSLLARVNDAAHWATQLRAVLTDDLQGRLRREATTRALPRWADTAAQILAGLR